MVAVVGHLHSEGTERCDFYTTLLVHIVVTLLQI